MQCMHVCIARNMSAEQACDGAFSGRTEFVPSSAGCRDRHRGSRRSAAQARAPSSKRRSKPLPALARCAADHSADGGARVANPTQRN